VTCFIDTNVVVRHLTGDPPEQAAQATAFLAAAEHLLLTDVVAAEMVYVLESFYQAPRSQVADAVRSLLTFASVSCVDRPTLLRAVELYEVHRLDFAETYLAACAESTGVGAVASFDRSLERVTSVVRIEP